MFDDDLPRRPQHSGRRRNSEDDTALLPAVRSATVAAREDRRWPRGRQPEFDSFAILAVVGVLTIVALLGVIVAGRAKDPVRSAPPNGAWVPAPPLASGLAAPVEVLPATTTGSTGEPTTGPYPVPIDTFNPTATVKPTAAVTTTTKKPSTPAPLLTANTKIGLEPADQPGFLVRHRFVWVRIDQIGSRSNSSDKADATFTVRKGLANPKCFSFESVNSPNNFLRHQNFMLWLQADDRSTQFSADATFCPATAKKSGTMVLQAQNYPGYYLNERNETIYLDKINPSSATAFRAKKAL
jgi:hypothetical protein